MMDLLQTSCHSPDYIGAVMIYVILELCDKRILEEWFDVCTIYIVPMIFNRRTCLPLPDLYLAPITHHTSHNIQSHHLVTISSHISTKFIHTITLYTHTIISFTKKLNKHTMNTQIQIQIHIHNIYDYNTHTKLNTKHQKQFILRHITNTLTCLMHVHFLYHYITLYTPHSLLIQPHNCPQSHIMYPHCPYFIVWHD